MLLSFDEAAKAYRCYRPSTRKVFISRDLFIDETAPSESHQILATKLEIPADCTPAPTTVENSRSRLDHCMRSISDSHGDGNLTQQPQLSSPTEELLPRPSPNDSEEIDPVIETTLLEPNTLLPPANPFTENEEPTAPSPANHPRRSERIRRFPKHLHDFAAHLELHLKILLQRTSPKTSPSSTLISTRNGKLPCKKRSIRSTTITHGLWFHFPPKKRTLPHVGYLKSNQASTAIKQDSKPV